MSSAHAMHVKTSNESEKKEHLEPIQWCPRLDSQKCSSKLTKQPVWTATSYCNLSGITVTGCVLLTSVASARLLNFDQSFVDVTLFASVQWLLFDLRFLRLRPPPTDLLEEQECPFGL
ncbi:hypothetical protein RRG08_013434 [Elysia crispata]|uniref:Uncharacterized protein n=1 Tax=Elysia crispata TaxID=231223 RepID=A0AAE1DJB3_9GAST|nr:hypothetical protein RRG08_013434 [Elysia crispata]